MKKILLIIILLFIAPSISAITANIDGYPSNTRWGDEITITVSASSCVGNWQGGIEFIDQNENVMSTFTFATVGGSLSLGCNTAYALHIGMDNPGYARFQYWKVVASRGGNWKLNLCVTDTGNSENDCQEVSWFVNKTNLFNISLDTLHNQLRGFQPSGGGPPSPEGDECDNWVSYGQEFQFLIAVNDANNLQSNIKTVIYDYDGNPVMSKAWASAESGYNWGKLSASIEFGPWDDSWLDFGSQHFYRAETTAINSEGLIISHNETFCTLVPFSMSYGVGVTYDCGGFSVPHTNGQQLQAPSMFWPCGPGRGSGLAWWQDDLGSQYSCGLVDVDTWPLGYFQCHVPCESYSPSRTYLLHANLSYVTCPPAEIPAILSSDLDLTDCGNSVKASDEECDGSNLGGASCTSLGLDFGTLACDAGCTYDYSDCGWTGGPIACNESWVASYGNCSVLGILKTYVDVNDCGTFDDLPVDNGTFINCTMSQNGHGNNDFLDSNPDYGIPVEPPVEPPVFSVVPGPEEALLNFKGLFAQWGLVFEKLFSTPLEAFIIIGSATTTYWLETLLLLIGLVVVVYFARENIKKKPKRRKK
jgi:hypothetical protein